MGQPQNDLGRILEKANGDVPVAPETEPTEQPAEKPKPQRSPAREGKKVIQGHYDKKVHLQLKMLCLQKELTLQEALAEALDAYFTLNDMPAIASKSSVD